jgi:hypothetical protein
MTNCGVEAMSRARQTSEELSEERSDIVILGRYGGLQAGELTYDINPAGEVVTRRGHTPGSNEPKDSSFAAPLISGMKVRNRGLQSGFRRILMVDFPPVARLDY